MEVPRGGSSTDGLARGSCVAGRFQLGLAPAYDPDVIPTRPCVARVGDVTVLRPLVLHADPELAIGFIDCANRIDPMPTEVMSCVLQVVFRTGKRVKRSFNFRVIPPSWGW